MGGTEQHRHRPGSNWGTVQLSLVWRAEANEAEGREGLVACSLSSFFATLSEAAEV